MIDDKFLSLQITEKVVVHFSNGEILEYLPNRVERVFINLEKVDSVSIMKGGGADD